MTTLNIDSSSIPFAKCSRRNIINWKKTNRSTSISGNISTSLLKIYGKTKWKKIEIKEKKIKSKVDRKEILFLNPTSMSVDLPS